MQCNTGGLRARDLDYRLPTERIAQQPAPERDGSRLLVVDSAAGHLHDTTFRDLPAWLAAGDLLVLNNTKVIPARFRARRATGAAIDGLFLSDRPHGIWQVMLRGRGRLRIGERLTLEPPDRGDGLELLARHGGGRWAARLVSDDDTETVIERIGKTPLPPYIHRTDEPDDADRQRYQTVFAERPGAVAAPTAALHFTQRVFDDLDRRGVDRAFLTLHVGEGTFAPIMSESLESHRMHVEWYDLPPDTADRVRACRSGGARVVAVGTTTVRVLETAADEGWPDERSGWTDVFIKPPYTFRAVDALLTNFHLPRSTLLALVMTFAGPELIRTAYTHAIDRGYRFYSYGDAMLIL